MTAGKRRLVAAKTYIAIEYPDLGGTNYHNDDDGYSRFLESSLTKRVPLHYCKGGT
jgi:hypothetical protein